MHDPRESHPGIHWPSGFSPAEAHGFHRAEAVVPGTPERAFSVLTDVPNWPVWIPDCAEVTPVTPARSFEVLWYGHWFEVFVGEHVEFSRVGWMAIGAGVRLYQTWLITEAGRGTHALVETAVRAAAPKPLDTLSRSWTRRLGDLWLAQHAKLSEDPSLD
ncbi:SRPBCC family protein [Streptomyces sp. HPF1205]|uniref:SRPBCC family protein n=1 Tax=Streptomyces sp. HPF1205 TaxID=2873262 RepID=UPI001CEC2F6E|nr:SRPBCC family protein [Streptomyces sp. HPF1205]